MYIVIPYTLRHVLPRVRVLYVSLSGSRHHPVEGHSVRSGWSSASGSHGLLSAPEGVGTAAGHRVRFALIAGRLGMTDDTRTDTYLE